MSAIGKSGMGYTVELVKNKQYRINMTGVVCFLHLKP